MAEDEETEFLDLSLPPKSSRKVVIRDTESDEKLEHERKTLRELLQRAYILLDDISKPFKNVERYDVQKWLEDAKPLLDK